MRDARPKLAVWKFASCDGCQLSLLNCEDELLAIAGLMRELERTMVQSGARRIVAVFVKVGALSPITPLHFREHFEHATAGTFADGAFLSVRQDRDPTGPFAQDVVVESIEVEE